MQSVRHRDRFAREGPLGSTVRCHICGPEFPEQVLSPGGCEGAVSLSAVRLCAY